MKSSPPTQLNAFGKFFLDRSVSSPIRGGVDPDENDLKETAEADRLVRDALQSISEHTDTVMIMVTKRLDNGTGETWRMVLGAGNWYARYGLVREWLNQEEGIQHRRYEVDDTED